LFALTEYGELNQTSLLSHCGLNIVAHKDILEDLEKKGLIKKVEEPWGSKKIIKYSITDRGIHVCKQVFDPYEELFPRKKKQ
jgi:predicted transcriptional regulator